MTIEIDEKNYFSILKQKKKNLESIIDGVVLEAISKFTEESGIVVTDVQISFVTNKLSDGKTVYVCAITNVKTEQL